MFVMLVLLWTLLKTVSPMKMSFMVTASSVLVGMTMVLQNSNLFPAAALIISFSSGMMILFCYCANLSNFEKKSLGSISYTLIAMITPLTMTYSENKMEMTQSTSTLMTSSAQFLILAMLIVLLTMLCVNKSMFHPQTPSMSSYY